MNLFFLIILFILGTVLGSFYGVLGSRLPIEKSIVKPGSHCEFCKHPLKWYELIPIISFLIQKGKCRKCHKKLSWMYLFTELFTGILFVASYLYLGVSYEFFVSLILSSLVTIIFVSDMKYMIILDSPLIVSGILFFALQWIYFGISVALMSLLNGFITFSIMFLIGKLGNFIFKKESLGGGDIKLSFLSGMILGIPLSVISLMLSSFLALPYAFACLSLKNDHEVPFGPFLISALWIVFFFLPKFQAVFDFLKFL